MRIIYYIWIIAMLIASLLFGNQTAAITQRMSGRPRQVFWIGTSLYARCGYLFPFTVYWLGLVSEVFATL